MKIKVNKSRLPPKSIAKECISFDYCDCYQSCILNIDNITPDDIQVAFWCDMPDWVNGLMNLRNSLVKVFGLRGKGDSTLEDVEKIIRYGGNNSFISVYNKSANENIIRITDKHLTAYMSVYIENINEKEAKIYCSTLVRFHKKSGKIYFAAIFPFHHIIVRSMIKTTLEKLIP